MSRAPWLALCTTFAALLVGTDASASVLRCWGVMRTSDCKETSQSWPATDHPTFGVACEACASFPDGGRCMPLDPGSQGFSLRVAGRSYGGEHFEMLGTSCGLEKLYRYNGPLEPGRRHEIVYPGNVDYSQPVRYVLAFDVDVAPTVDAGSDGGMESDAHADEPRDTRRAEAAVDGNADPGRAPGGGRDGGCSHVPGAPGTKIPLVALLALALLGLARRWHGRRRFRSSDNRAPAYSRRR